MDSRLTTKQVTLIVAAMARGASEREAARQAGASKSGVRKFAATGCALPASKKGVPRPRVGPKLSGDLLDALRMLVSSSWCSECGSAVLHNRLHPRPLRTNGSRTM
jgi:hypothetical protein